MGLSLSTSLNQQLTWGQAGNTATVHALSTMSKADTNMVWHQSRKSPNRRTSWGRRRFDRLEPPAEGVAVDLVLTCFNMFKPFLFILRGVAILLYYTSQQKKKGIFLYTAIYFHIFPSVRVVAALDIRIPSWAWLPSTILNSPQCFSRCHSHISHHAHVRKNTLNGKGAEKAAQG